MKEHELILTSLLNCRRIDLYVNPLTLDFDQKKQYEHILEKRANGYPLQYLIGHCEFYGNKIHVDERVLIPRPETEILIENILKHIKLFDSNKTVRILELGTGSGNIAIALAKNIAFAEIKSVDISREALELAQYNARVNGVLDKITFLYEDMNSFLKQEINVGHFYDFVVSNPPYIETGIIASLPKDVLHEPRLALDGGRDGLFFYKEIIFYTHRLLDKNGFLFLEIGDNQDWKIKEIFSQYPEYQLLKFEKDFTQMNRVVLAQI